MKRKKYRLRQWVKDLLLTIIIGVVLGVILIFALKEYSKTARQCDEYYGHICSIYEVDQYGKGIRR